MSKKKRIDELKNQILFYADGQISESIAKQEAINYFKRRGIISNIFVHESSLSSMGKKLAMKCLGTPYV